MKNLLSPLFIFLFAFSYAQNASYNETIEWLQAKTMHRSKQHFTCLGNTVQYECTDFQALGDSIKITLKSKFDNNIEVTEVYTVKLSDLSPQEVNITSIYNCEQWKNSISLHTYMDKNKIHYKSYGGYDEADKHTNVILLPMDNDEMANRIVNAFQHAIRLKGGKEEKL